jgi:hypothetical protein
VARAFNTLSGPRPQALAAFLIAQLIGVVRAVHVGDCFLAEPRARQAAAAEERDVHTDLSQSGCGTSRIRLGIIRQSNAEPQLIEYLKAHPRLAQEILDNDHYRLDEVKDRMLEHLAPQHR